MDFSIEATNLDALREKCHGDKLLGDPIKHFLDRSADKLKQQVRDFTPVGVHGDLRGSIQKDMDGATLPLWASVGTRLVPHYGPDVEYGTRPHWPPISAIAEWANAHGIPPFLVARAIARRGTAPHNMFGGALEVCGGDIRSFEEQACREIEAIWGGG